MQSDWLIDILFPKRGKAAFQDEWTCTVSLPSATNRLSESHGVGENIDASHNASTGAGIRKKRPRRRKVAAIKFCNPPLSPRLFCWSYRPRPRIATGRRRTMNRWWSWWTARDRFRFNEHRRRVHCRCPAHLRRSSNHLYWDGKHGPSSTFQWQKKTDRPSDKTTTKWLCIVYTSVTALSYCQPTDNASWHGACLYPVRKAITNSRLETGGSFAHLPLCDSGSILVLLRMTRDL